MTYIPCSSSNLDLSFFGFLAEIDSNSFKQYFFFPLEHVLPKEFLFYNKAESPIYGVCALVTVLEAMCQI